MTELFLNVSGTFLTMGLPAIDQSLDSLLEAMQNFPAETYFGNGVALAKTVGLILALCVGSYEAWMMMLGRRGMDIMKLFRIFALSCCISGSSWICSALASPGKSLESSAKSLAQKMNEQVNLKEQEVAKLQAKYLDRLKDVQDSIQQAKEVQAIGEDPNMLDKMMYSVSNMNSVIGDTVKQWSMVAMTKLTEIINDVIRFIGMLIFQLTYYGMFLAQRCFMTILTMFCPIAFALSIVPPWGSAWSQFISKYLSLSLWGFVIYICVYYTDYLLLYCLEKDITAYTALIGNADNTWSQLGTLGIQGIGTTCFYAMGMIAGAFLLKFVPEVASWLIPGGAGTSIGSAMGGAANSAVSYAAGKAGSAVKSTVSAPVTVAKKLI